MHLLQPRSRLTHLSVVVKHAGKKRTLGEFDSAQEAARAHDREALRCARSLCQRLHAATDAVCSHLGHDAAAARLNFPVEDQPAEAELTSRKRPREPDNANVAPALPPPGHRLALPDGWLECPRMGGLFCQHLVPCKVPLGRRFNEVLCGALEAKRFTPADAVRLAQTAPEGSVQKRRVVAVINLTKTSRYYSPEEEGLGGDIRYFNLRCDGAGGAPSAEEVNAFVCLVESVLGDARLAQTPFCPVILVHCTHGYNRTGAMLVHHAMRTQGARPDLVAALGAFARCRPPCGIYKEDYIACACDRPALRLVFILDRAPQRCSPTTTTCDRSRRTQPARPRPPGSASRGGLLRCATRTSPRETCGVRARPSPQPPAPSPCCGSSAHTLLLHPQAWTTSPTSPRAR